MTSVLPILIALQASLGISTVEGQIVGPDHQPVPRAQVFLEPGLGGQLKDTVASDTGHFSFPDVQPGGAGLFAIAPGYGFTGRHLTIAVADVVPPLTIVLQPAATLEGVVKDPKGAPISGARVTRFAVKGAHKVGIPLAKLKQFGYPEPAADASGRFTLEHVPAGTLVDLKIGHPNFAQEGVIDASPGGASIEVTMHPGVLVEGEVISRANKGAIAQAVVLIQNAQPPHDTATATSGLSGKFSVRLKPGVYLYQAQGAGMKSAGWERLTITGERPVERLRLAVAGFGTLRGNVRDAVTGNPLRDIRITLNTNGVEAAVVRTGPGGDFQFSAGEGENTIRLDSTPGYFPPDTQHMKVSILEGTDVELPGMWLRPLPNWQVQVVDGAGQPVPKAAVTLLRPAQIGWHLADDQGLATIHLQNFPDSGEVLGRAEDPRTGEVALFRLHKDQQGPGTVELFAPARVEGRVVNSRGRAVEGAPVGAFFPGEAASDAILLWQTFSNGEGNFAWEAVVPGVPQRVVARGGDEGGGESATFNLAPGATSPLGDINVAGGRDANSRQGKKLDWKRLPARCGDVPSNSGEAALLVYAPPANVAALQESLARVKETLALPGLSVAIVSSGAPECIDSPIPVLGGEAVGAATTLLVDASGTVVLETAGLPPVAAMRRIAP